MAAWQPFWAPVRWVLLTTVFLALVIWTTLTIQRDVVIAAIDDAFSSQVRADVDLVAALIAVRDQAHLDLATAELPRQRRITLIGSDGTVLFDSQEDPHRLDNHNSRPEVQEARRSGYGESRRHSDSTSQNYLYVAKRLADGRVLRVAVLIDNEAMLERRLARPTALASGAVAALVGLILGWQLWRDRRRVAELVGVARAFANGEFSRRAGLLGGDPLAHLGHELNTMGERLLTSQKELAGQKALLDAALATLSEGVACIDPLDRVLYANSAYCQLAAGGAEVIGQSYYEHLPVLGQASDSPESATAQAGGPARMPPEGIASAFAHRRRQLRAIITPVDTGVRVVVLHDLTEVTRLEGARRDFIASVSHELKTPLTSISGFAETLLDGALANDPEIARDFVEKIIRHSDRLAEIVRDVMTLSRLEQGAWECRPMATDLVQLCRTIIEEYLRPAERQQVSVLLEAPDRLGAMTDPELVRQLVGNLVSNAIRYNRPKGSVWLRLALTDGNRVRLTVEDTGIGIPADHRERIFERFYRVDAHRSRQSGGTGLGLAIVKQLLAVLDGTITLDSDATGTRFTVLLPRTDPRAELAASTGLGSSRETARL